MNKIKINFKVNNVSLEKEINANVILADFIRYDLKLTGTHIGCDTSQCGSCIVMIDDKCIKSCSVLLAQCNNKKITTVEVLEKMITYMVFKRHLKIIMAYNVVFARLEYCFLH